MQQFILETRSLTKTYWATDALDSVSLRVPSWSIFGLLGPNGAWKSTFMKIISGIIHKTSGQVNIFWSERSIRDLEQLGVLIESPILYKNLSAYENMKIFAAISKINYSKKR